MSQNIYFYNFASLTLNSGKANRKPTIVKVRQFLANNDRDIESSIVTCFLSNHCISVVFQTFGTEPKIQSFVWQPPVIKLPYLTASSSYYTATSQTSPLYSALSAYLVKI